MLQLARENCIDGDKIRAGDAVNFSIGQGDTVVTPIKLAQMYAAIANGGTIWKPTIAKAIVKTDGTVLRTFKPEKLGDLGVDQETLIFLRDALREVTLSGTAAGAFSGFPVATAGKTGTAQVFGRECKWQRKGRHLLVCIIRTREESALRRCHDGEPRWIRIRHIRCWCASDL